MIMKILKLLVTAILGSGLSVYGQSLYPGMDAGVCRVKDFPAMRMKCFPLDDVRLLPGRFLDNVHRDSAWMVSIPVNSLLHSFRTNAGVFSGSEGGYFFTRKLGGWESLDCDLRGHCVGHLLSAYALMYAQTGSEVFKMKGDSLVAGLADVQEALGQSGYLSAFPENLIDRITKRQPAWAPWYTLHKILSGLIDQYIYSNNRKALNVARKMSLWAYTKVSALDSISLQNMIKYEYGGINESFYNMYAITGDKKFFDLAQRFYLGAHIEPLKHQENSLGSLHANTFIPKVLAEARKYELTGDTLSRSCAEYFMKLIDENYAFVNGEVGDHEHFFAPNEMNSHLTGYDGEGCCTYNLLKLCRHLFCWSGDEKVMDYYERALYNHILGQQDPKTGMICYFTPMQSGAYKVYSTLNNSYWCCVGTAFESNAKYGEAIYAYNDEGIYVNLLISSVLNWKERGIILRQETNFPEDDKTTLRVMSSRHQPFTLFLRYPSWSGKVNIRINGKHLKTDQKAGCYVAVRRRWKSGDIIQMECPMHLTTVPLPSDTAKAALVYGPIVLAGELGTDGMTPPAPYSNSKKYNDYYRYDFHVPSGLHTSINKADVLQLKKDDKNLEFMTKDHISIIPLYDIHRLRYVVYWDMK
jgi:DUF1680 family protein